ncbi:MAG: DUF5011 domain-containing protein [Bacilli bacterium]
MRKKKTKLNIKNIVIFILIILLIIFCLVKLFTKKNIKDKEAPILTLTGSDITIFINSQYKEPGFKAIDKIDGDLTNKVKVEGQVDYKKAGLYELKYTVSDKSKNKVTKTRKVTVSKDSPLDMSIKDFKLSGLFPDVLLKETTNLGSNYSDEFIYMGDSVPLYYVINDIIPGTKLWHKEGINPETALTNSIYINHQETNKTFIENIAIKKPKKVLLTLGSNSAAYMESAFFIKNYKKLLLGMQEVSKDTIFIVQSIPPVSKNIDETSALTNKKINNLNYYLLEMCNELNIPFLNSAEVLKDEEGHLKEGYYIKDGIHLTANANELIMKYFQNHTYKK